MTTIGIIGFGFMGRMHLEAYAEVGATVGGIAEVDLSRITADSSDGNIAGAGFDPVLLDGVRTATDAMPLFEDDAIDAVSICVPTAFHAELAIAALEHGKHVLVEKPLALTGDDAARVVQTADAHPDLVCMPAMCMRFWPGWRWLKEAIDDRRYGAVRSAVFTRLGAVPAWDGGFYRDPARSGSAILDLHIHDADFVRYCFGDPTAVDAVGSLGNSGGLDHVTATYRFDGGPGYVVAEGGWMSAPGFPFTMRYYVDFENATAEFDLGRPEPLVVHGANGEPETVALPSGTGYKHEIAHFLAAIERGAAPEWVKIDDGEAAVRLIEAERASVDCGERVAFSPRG